MKPFAGAFLSLLLLAATYPQSASAADAPDSSSAQPATADTSTVALPPSSGSSTAPDSSRNVTVTLRNGAEYQYGKVESWPGNLVRGLRSDGKYDYIPKNEIAKITGEVPPDVLAGESVKIPEEKEPKGPSAFRGRPLPERKGFPLFQAGLLSRLNDPPNGGESNLNVWFDAGGMVNVSPKVSLGGTVGVASDFEYSRIAVKARLRRWLGGGLAIDFAPGIIVPKKGSLFESDPKREGTGLVGELALVSEDLFSISYMIEIIEEDRTSLPGTDTDVGHHFGLKAGGGIGVLGVWAILVGLFAASD